MGKDRSSENVSSVNLSLTRQGVLEDNELKGASACLKTFRSVLINGL